MVCNLGQHGAAYLPTRCAGGTYFSTHFKEHTPDAKAGIAGCIARCITHTPAKTQQYQGIAAVPLGTDALTDSRCDSPKVAMQMRCTGDAKVHHFLASAMRPTKKARCRSASQHGGEMLLSMTPNKQCGAGMAAYFEKESAQLDYWSGGAQKDWLSFAVNQEASAQIMDGKLPMEANHE